MLFSSITFLYYFLPITLALYFIIPMPNGSPRRRNLLLLAASLIFYAWGEPVYVFVMIFQCATGWAFGLWIERTRSRRIMILSIIMSLSALIFFKYTDFFIWNLNAAFRADIPLLRMLLPIGISFYTFQILSYLIDVYRGQAAAQRNLADFSTYVALFPQLTAGPIVRYSDVAGALSKRTHSIGRFAHGACRFTLGLAKKVLIANVMGELVEIYRNSGENSLLFTWMYLVAYSMQIYFDFSGYSDMAIGLGHMLGFKFPENFNYPYISRSITEFWRRWHMTLGSWFRDYVYIPLGGNRVKLARNVLNIAVVWMLTGFWHGADWQFIIWGLYFAIVMLAEKFIFVKILERTPNFLRHVYVMLVVFISWSFFDAPGVSASGKVLGSMFGIGIDSLAGSESLYYLRSYLIPLMVAIIGCTPLPKLCAKRFAVLEPLAVGVLLVMVTAYLLDSSFNPFIYFRF